LTSERVGLDVPTVERMIKRGSNTHFNPVTGNIIKSQQDQADLFTKLGVLPKSIDVKQVVLTPREYAALLPDSEGGIPQRLAQNP